MLTTLQRKLGTAVTIVLRTASDATAADAGTLHRTARMARRKTLDADPRILARIIVIDTGRTAPEVLMRKRRPNAATVDTLRKTTVLLEASTGRLKSRRKSAGRLKSWKGGRGHRKSKLTMKNARQSIVAVGSVRESGSACLSGSVRNARKNDRRSVRKRNAKLSDARRKHVELNATGVAVSPYRKSQQ